MAILDLIGSSEKFQAVLDEVRVVAQADCSVLIHGETGTGKEVIAHAIHESSLRQRGPFVAINCAAIPAPLLESELFGHEKGAFTGAIAQTIGRFQAAHGGTLFLDEIGDLPLELQPKLLRVLQEQQYERLGSTRTIRTDVRVIAATNQDLSRMVEEKTFRADLYYRLSVFPINLPPLRERKDDIPLLVKYFMRRFSRQMGKSIDEVPDSVMEILKSYRWPGNIRELQNFVERSAIVTQGRVLSLAKHRAQTSGMQAVYARTSPDAVRCGARAHSGDFEGNQLDHRRTQWRRRPPRHSTDNSHQPHAKAGNREQARWSSSGSDSQFTAAVSQLRRLVD